MALWESFKIALTSIRNHKIRSFLTMLGIIIGVGAVIIVVAIGEGAKEEIRDEFFNVDENVIEIYYEPFPPEDEDDMTWAWEEPELTELDIEALRTVPGVKAVIGINWSFGMMIHGENQGEMEITGVDDGFFSARNIQVVEGRAFTDADVRSVNRVVMIDTDAREKFFKQSDSVIGEIVEIQGNPYRVVGVYESPIPEQYRYAESGELMMPRSLLSLMFGAYEIENVSVIADSPDTVSQAGMMAAEKLTELKQLEDGYFTTYDMSQFEEELDQYYRTMTLFIGSIAAISLLVGGIGVMNIMLVSVTERTSEIGLRKSIGATRGKILLQFLIEAVTLTSLGGIIGIGFAAAVSFIVTQLFGLQAIISLPVVIIGVTFSAFIGIVFGIIPANKASKLNPIDALRYE